MSSGSVGAGEVDGLEGCDRVTVIKFRMDNGGGNTLLNKGHMYILQNLLIILYARWQHKNK